MQGHLYHTMSVGEAFTGMIRGREDLFEIMAKPRFGLTVFRVRGGVGGVEVGEEEERSRRANGLTKKVYEKVNAGGEVYLTSTVLGGVYAIRVITGAPNAEERFMRRAFELLVKAVEEVAGVPVEEGAAMQVKEELERPHLRGV